MTEALHLVQLSLDARRLAKWALERRIGAEDIGYSVHALMCDSYGHLRLQPFQAEEKMGAVKVLGYGSVSAEEMEQVALEVAEPETISVIRSIASKPMPMDWKTGRRLAFKVRVAPTRQGHAADGRRREADALQFEPGNADRETTYRSWLANKIGDAANIDSLAMTSFRLAKTARRAFIEKDGKRPAVSVILPDAIFEGVLRVDNVENFSRILRCGVGRHRSFGFGAMMIRPTQSS